MRSDLNRFGYTLIFLPANDSSIVFAIGVRAMDAFGNLRKNMDSNEKRRWVHMDGYRDDSVRLIALQYYHEI